jgi:hypothetical protein
MAALKSRVGMPLANFIPICPIMKMPPLLLFSALLASRAWCVEQAIPAALPAERYAALSEKSPFALATPAAPMVTPQASFAANWFVSGIARVGDTDFVTIKARDLSTQFSLFGHEPNAANGVSVASVNWEDTVGKSTVILQKGTEIATLAFNEADLRGPQSAAQPPPLGANLAGGIPVPQPIGMPPQPMGIPRPGNPPVVMPPQATRQLPAAPPNPNEVHRRIRIINQPK